ncbi:hypothetical protein [Mesorhizobium sp. M4B.F.Ca.ET.058.02.1.1]|uniref:hypothetical protein n=1 Tax=Mesorhizobium sp. M4B.F.Ca.ET.058.02.1.1 TaxID=2493675 RepID=UPI00167DB92B|nr:hypothetical protein [Mesorhizobium sp. M4B.F.Ca.ET.058.02.1.1]
MNKREIKQRIYLTGSRMTGYQVFHNIPGPTIDCFVDSAKIGNAIIRALRELAYKDNQK